MSDATGAETMSNFEVLKWMRDKKKRQAKEDREAEAEGLVFKPRPSNLKKAFDKHERHLTREVYPYEKNPSVHNDNYDVDEVVTKFNNIIIERIYTPNLKKHKAKAMRGEITHEQGQDKYDEECEKKCLSETELMQIHNLAPTGIEALQLIIEQWDERFTEEEMGILLTAISKILRPDEPKKKGLEETAKMHEAVREMSPFSARASTTKGPVINNAQAPGEVELAFRPTRPDSFPVGWAVNAQRTGANEEDVAQCTGTKDKEITQHASADEEETAGGKPDQE